MRNKLVLWATNAQDERVLVTMELRIESNEVVVRTYQESVVTDEVYQTMMDKWRADQPMDLPEVASEETRDLTMTDPLLPDTLKVERGDLIQRAQTEWHYMVLSARLSQTYQSELAEIEDRIDRAERFENDLWNNLKAFWERIQSQLRDRTLLREHADELRNRTNAQFAKLKELRSKLDDEFRLRSRENSDRFQELLTDIEKRIEEGQHLNQVFNDLRELQQQFRSTKFTKEHRNKIWDRLDKAFKEVKLKRFGSAKQGDGSPLERTKRRYEGLLKAIEKMERSIQRDENDLKFENRRIASTDGQLEAQIRQAKIQMIVKRIESKQEKLEEMLKTKSQLENRMEKQRKREEQLAEKQRIREAEEEAKRKIAEQIQSSAEQLSDEEAEKLQKAAQEMGLEGSQPNSENGQPAKQKSQPAEQSSTLIGAAAGILSESLVDVVDTIRAVAEVVGDHIEDQVDKIKDQIEDQIEEVKDQLEGNKEESEEE